MDVTHTKSLTSLPLSCVLQYIAEHYDESGAAYASEIANCNTVRTVSTVFTPFFFVVASEH